MSLGELQVRNVRCIASADLRLGPGFNLIWGGNGAGKTSLLEAIFLLGRGRSFRTRHADQLVRRETDRLTVFGRTDGILGHSLGIECDRKLGVQARTDGSSVASLADLTRVFPVQIIEPEVHKLVEEGGRRRRRWLDWAVFHVEPRFGDHWLRYSRALRQRNAALKSRAFASRPWETELVPLGEQIAAARRDVIERLQPHWQDVLAALHAPSAELRYSQGWPESLDLGTALEVSRTRDTLRQQTHCGPHRADVPIQVGGKSAREVLSRGQQKLVAAALVLSQLRLLRETTGIAPTLLLDDPAAELDVPHLAGFVDVVSGLGCQLIVTALQPAVPLFGNPESVFHVEQGHVGPV